MPLSFWLARARFECQPSSLVGLRRAFRQFAVVPHPEWQNRNNSPITDVLHDDKTAAIRFAVDEAAAPCPASTPSCAGDHGAHFHDLQGTRFQQGVQCRPYTHRRGVLHARHQRPAFAEVPVWTPNHPMADGNLTQNHNQSNCPQPDGDFTHLAIAGLLKATRRGCAWRSSRLRSTFCPMQPCTPSWPVKYCMRCRRKLSIIDVSTSPTGASALRWRTHARCLTKPAPPLEAKSALDARFRL